MSVLEDEPEPVRKHKKKSDGELFVVACGVRKVWSKELKGLDKPSEQIRHLRKMLMDLGMKGRMSLEQAKAIRQKREFQQELKDVKADEEDDDNLWSDVDVKRQPRLAITQSINAFLGDVEEGD
ncbi:uncharacterized protein BXZ73DRAFT_98576 [Epithele typhae]|uniref:uncharacterized protein n=1 Tax=Epithele typhae TaxID=378194 RepID=UPI002007F171|nr:uncharacterized protein BXZ73DRAFT_98576 [Epithele typhae]KAH9940746.1 hypothetical protein BXZ73DRAFT_98576 [Epithele typhae]